MKQAKGKEEKGEVELRKKIWQPYIREIRGFRNNDVDCCITEVEAIFDDREGDRVE